LFHATYGDYYVSGFVHGSSYWLQCEVDNSEVHSDSSISLTAGVDVVGKGNASAGFSAGVVSNNSKKFSNVTRHLSGHDLSKLSGGPIDITTAA
jgi:hypothetical protein